MEFFDLIKSRHSSRAYKNQLLEKEKLQQILDVADTAPSAGNLKAYKIFVVEEAAKKEVLAKAALEQTFIAEAPVVLVFCADPGCSAQKYGERGKKLYCIQDASIAASYAQLAAAALGLGTCWVGAFDEKEVLKILDALKEASKELRPVCIMPIGYAA